MSTNSTLAQLAENRADALDRLIHSDAQAQTLPEGDVLILEDSNLSLTLWALAQNTGRVFVRNRSYRDSLNLYRLLKSTAPEALARTHIAGFNTDGSQNLKTLDPLDFLTHHGFTGNLAYGRLPKSHGALADWAEALARVTPSEDACLILGGNTKHMNPNFNKTLEASFGEVRGLRGKGKHRCLLARGARAHETAEETPGAASEKIGQQTLQAFGGVFSGAKADRGGQLLATAATDFLGQQSGRLEVLDFGCGNGSVSLQLLTSTEPGRIAALTATDLDADAVRSARVNLADFSGVQVTWDDAASALEDSRFDLILLNPPFHDGTRLDLTMVQPLLDAAARLLSEGGSLLLVHNSHARYRPQIEARFGSVEQVARDKTFTVLKAEAPRSA